MFDLSHNILGAIMGLVQWVLLGCVIVILIAYWQYRKRQV